VDPDPVRIRVLSSVTLRMPQKIIFFEFFSYNLPTGTFSSVFMRKGKDPDSQHCSYSSHSLLYLPQVLSDASKELLNRGPVQIDLDEGQKEAFLR
jgi:hypothetical protein